MQYGGDPQCCSALAGDKREEKPLTSGSLGNCGCPAPPFMTGFLCYKSVTKWILYYEGNLLRDRAQVSLTQAEKNTDFFGVH